MKSSESRVRIVGVIAEVIVTQVYQNCGASTIEATYIFPASTRAAVHGLKMQVGDRVVVASIEEKKKARAVYEAAKNERKTTSLLEQNRPNVFQMNLANILPGDEVIVELSYTEWIRSEKGVFEFTYPMSIGPRYSGKDTEEIDTWVSDPYLEEGDAVEVMHDIFVELEAGLPIHAIRSPSHKIKVEFRESGGAVVALNEARKKIGDRDFVLKYSLSGNSQKSGLIVSKGSSDSFFLAMIQPPSRNLITRELNKEYVFVIDVSGSMYGYPLDTAKVLMKRLFDTLSPKDRFNILLFAGASTFLSEESIVATAENKELAFKFLKKEHGGGGTELLPALKRVYEQPPKEGVSRSAIVITDGYISAESELFQLVESSLKSCNVFSFGIGSSVNHFLIEGLARAGHGEASVVLGPKEARSKAKLFSEYITTPLLTDIGVDWNGIDLYGVEPRSIPDLMAERPVYIFGKWDGDLSGVINIRGQSVDGDYITSLDFSKATILSAEDRSLELMWARNRIQRLSDYNTFGIQPDLKQEITNLGLTHGLLTKYTSFVAVDQLVRTEKGERVTKVAQALTLPKGVSNKAVGGQSVPVTPEPSSIALIITSFLFVGFIIVRRIRWKL